MGLERNLPELRYGSNGSYFILGTYNYNYSEIYIYSTSLPVTGDSDRLGTIIYVVTVETFATLAGKAHSFT